MSEDSCSVRVQYLGRMQRYESMRYERGEGRREKGAFAAKVSCCLLRAVSLTVICGAVDGCREVAAGRGGGGRRVAVAVERVKRRDQPSDPTDARMQKRALFY